MSGVELILASVALAPPTLHLLHKAWGSASDSFDITLEIELFCLTARQVRHDLDYANRRYAEMSDLVHQDGRLQQWIIHTLPRTQNTLERFESLLPKMPELDKDADSMDKIKHMHDDLKGKIKFKWSDYSMVQNVDATLRCQHASLLAGINILNNLALYNQARDRANDQTDDQA
ncbi:hypothetical protein ACHAPT_012549 [Fusarium lateritium]